MHKGCQQQAIFCVGQLLSTLLRSAGVTKLLPDAYARVQVSHRPEWSMVLPTDPNRYPLECGFTYGITSRTVLWSFVKGVIEAVCRSCPGEQGV